MSTIPVLPTGYVDEIVFAGKRHGKNLSLFQSIGSAVWGLDVLSGIGLPSLISEFYHPAFTTDLRAILLAA